MKKNYVFFVGIDISARTLDVVMGCNEKGKKHFCFTNNAKGISELFTTINRLHSNLHEVLICCEHTGVYMDKLTYALQSTDIDLWVVHPLLLSNYSIELNRFKSDKADAKKIFLYAITHCSRAVAYQRCTTDVQTLKDLFMLRKQILQDRTAWRCRIHAASQKAIPNALELALHNELITLLSKFIKQIDNAIKQLIRSSAHIKELYAILISIPGIGPVIAHHMLLLTDCFTRFTSWKAFACFVGTTAYGKQSGTTLKKKARTSKQAHRKLKADLNQGIVSICTHNPLFQLVYQQLEQKRIPHLQILNNIKNVLIKLAFTLVNKRTKYDEQLFFKNKKSWQNILALS
jgi:transposase